MLLNMCSEASTSDSNKPAELLIPSRSSYFSNLWKLEGFEFIGKLGSPEWGTPQWRVFLDLSLGSKFTKILKNRSVHFIGSACFSNVKRLFKMLHTHGCVKQHIYSCFVQFLFVFSYSQGKQKLHESLFEDKGNHQTIIRPKMFQVSREFRMLHKKELRFRQVS
jgi:hypothetical protein